MSVCCDVQDLGGDVPGEPLPLVEAFGIHPSCCDSGSRADGNSEVLAPAFREPLGSSPVAESGRRPSGAAS